MRLYTNDFENPKTRITKMIPSTSHSTMNFRPYMIILDINIILLNTSNQKRTAQEQNSTLETPHINQSLFKLRTDGNHES